ncbi:MAG: electron transfer flavoprotein subunit alpha/FixB family protein, partial [Actinobacteria bacterium]|nr:electron transfer flavoprotein subunit alpha/FixB family protein [Actinomycetota bacterium]
MTAIPQSEGPGREPRTPGPGDAAGACLLVVVEPAAEGSQAPGPAAGALAYEGVRLARELGVEPYLLTWPAQVEPDLEPVAAALAAFIEGIHPLAVVMADTDIGRELAPLVAYRMGSAAVVGCSDVQARHEVSMAGRRGAAADGGSLPRTPIFIKPVFGGWLEREIEPRARIVPIATLDLADADESGSASPGPLTAEVLDLEAATRGPGDASHAEARVRHLETIPPDPRTVDLVHAKRVVAAGSGSANVDLLAAVQELADLLEGSVGATRPVVDDGRLPKERLIGQTGKTVAPELYLALGISGQPHHVAGVRKAERILCINRDVRAPIFQFSDIGYVADLEAVLSYPEITS